MAAKWIYATWEIYTKELKINKKHTLILLQNLAILLYLHEGMEFDDLMTKDSERYALSNIITLTH